MPTIDSTLLHTIITAYSPAFYSTLGSAKLSTHKTTDKTANIIPNDFAIRSPDFSGNKTIYYQVHISIYLNRLSRTY